MIWDCLWSSLVWYSDRLRYSDILIFWYSDILTDILSEPFLHDLTLTSYSGSSGYIRILISKSDYGEHGYLMIFGRLFRSTPTGSFTITGPNGPRCQDLWLYFWFWFITHHSSFMIHDSWFLILRYHHIFLLWYDQSDHDVWVRVWPFSYQLEHDEQWSIVSMTPSAPEMRKSRFTFDPCNIKTKHNHHFDWPEMIETQTPGMGW